MSEEWDFYQLLVDDEPASIYLDLGLARNGPVAGLPHMAYLRVKMRQPRPDGLSSSEEFEALCALEDSLVEGVAREGTTIFAGRNTSGGNRDFFFYTVDPAKFSASANAAMSRCPEYQFEIGGRPDPDWSVYFNFLSPSPDDLQRILNRRVIDQLVSHGDDLAKARLIEHLAYIPNADASARLRSILSDQGFEVSESKEHRDTISLSFTRVDRPEEVDDVVIPIARLISEMGGEYDGWGCEVEQ